MSYVRDIAEKWLDWSQLGPIAQQHHTLIAADVKVDTRKLDSTDAFTKSLTSDVQGEGGFRGPGGGGSIGLKNFANQRRVFRLKATDVKKVEIRETKP